MGIYSALGILLCKIIRGIIGECGFNYLYTFYWRVSERKKCRYGPYNFNHESDLEQLDYFTSTNEKLLEYRRVLKDKETDSILVFGTNSKNDRFLARISINAQGHASTWLDIWLSNGRTFHKDEGFLYNAPSTTNDSFIAGGLRMRCLIPLRKWKISFNGTLEEKDSDGITRNVHARMNLIWTAFANPHDLKTDITPTTWASFYSDQIDSSKHSSVSDDLDCLVQAGSLVGSINLDGEEQIDLCLFGSRKRSTERNLPDSPDHFEVMMSTFEGQAFHVGCLTFPNIKPNLKYGYVVVKNSRSTTTNVLKLICENQDVKRIDMSSDLWNFELKFDEPSVNVSYPMLETDYGAQVKFTHVTTNDDAGIALIFHHSRSNGDALTQKPSLSLPKIVQSVTGNNFVVSLNETSCRDTLFTGGKGSSLGCLYYLKDKIQPEYSVPKGLVVTTVAYEEFAKAINISNEVKKLGAVAWTNKSNEEIEEACKKAVAYVTAQSLPSKLSLAVEAKLKVLFGNEVHKKKFAVRSSASGEDSEEMSAAGQMQTFLGVSGINKINDAIVGCWASQFSFTAIQYKRQNGQLLNSPMAVVVQEMVPAEVAGVMFTCDPVTGNPKNVTLTANYGIGESVVSASADPDTIVFERSGKDASMLTLKSSVVGGKATQFIMRDNGGVEEVSVGDSQRKACCLSVDKAQDLARIAVKVEEIYGCPLDLEWAISESEIYLLQARPITTVDQDSDSFLEIEGHTALKFENEYITRANVGEVLSGVISPLGIYASFIAFNIHSYRHFSARDKNMVMVDPFAQMGSCQFFYHGFMRMTDFIFRHYKKGSGTFFAEAMMIACFGRLLYDEENKEMLDIIARRNEFNKPVSAIKNLYYALSDVLFCRYKVIRDTKIYRKISLEVNRTDSAAEMLDSIMKQYLNMSAFSARHMECSGATSMVNCAVMYILVSCSGGWKTETFNDLSRILSSCPDVESASVPAAMDDLAIAIIRSPYKDEFAKLTKEDALDWLLQTESEPGKKFLDFLKKHGHRCVNEFDVHSLPWGTNPLPLVETIQDMVRNFGNAKKPKPNFTVKEIMDGLSTPLTWKSRLLLRFLIPLSQRNVGCRELSKSLAVYGINLLRQSLAEVAKKMVLEGRLPEADLFYYLTPKEIKFLMETRSSRLVQKAVRRRTLLPKLNEYKFSEILKGFPKPINKVVRENTAVEASFTMKGIPVSEGFIKARCRVALTLQDAKQIQQGEILITYGTDIGWSPFFPMLSGVATELGGLISHGAVVAREYGLPCVVGVHGATEKFRSGDLVVLDGTKGLLQKVEE